MLGALGRLVAPDVEPLHDLQHHWAKFLEYYSSRSLLQLKAEPVEETLLTFHLNKILSILVTEQEEENCDLLSPCLEFFLHQDVLNILVALCQADSPPGIRPYIFKVFIFLLHQVKYPLLYETACHLPLCRLTLVCSLTKASPTESQEIEFLSLLCDKVKAEPHLVQVFLPEEKSGSTAASNLSSRSSRSSSMINLEQIQTLAINVKQILESVESRHYLGTALLNYLDSSDYCLTCRVMENIINLAGVDSDESASALVFGSPLILQLVNRTKQLFKNIPEDVEAGRIEELEVNWIQAHKLHSQEFSEDAFSGRTELISFLSFLDFIDNLVDGSHELVGSSIASSVGPLLVETFRHLLAQPEHHKKVLGLSYLGVTWNHVKSTLLSNQITFAMFDESEPEPLTQNTSLMNQILSFWLEDGELRIESMRIFDTLLSSPNQNFIDALIANELESRGYYNQSGAESEVSCWSDVEDEREKSRSRSSSRERSEPKHREQKKICQAEREGSEPKQLEQKMSRKEAGRKLVSKTLAPSNIHRVVNLWLYLVDDELRLDELRGSGYDLYIKDAGRQCEEAYYDCIEFVWGPEAIFPPQLELHYSSDTDSRCESDPTRGEFCPGSFSTKLFCALGKMLESDYDTNLQITSIFSRLAQLPHPYVHEYILNPTIPRQEGVQTLYTKLRSVMAEATKMSSSVEHYPKKMLYARRKLLGEGVAADETVFDDVQQENLFQAVVVIDEFCKELAAISLVKYHLYSSS